MKTPQNWLKGLTILLMVLSLVACGSDTEEVKEEIILSKTCVVDDDKENTNDECGNLLIGLTDADGDFLNYAIDVTGFELTKQDGTQVSVITSPQSVNFVDYVELTELTAVATIPAGIYTAGQITLDYSNADIQVEKDGVAVAAIMVDDEGEKLSSQTLQLEFDQNNRLVITRGRAAMLSLDFNLAASHSVNLTSEPVTVTTEAFIMAEVDPLENKEFRVRGPLISVDESTSSFRLAVRPFHRRDGRFGGTNVFVNDETNYEINEVTYLGAEGLAQMALLESGTATRTLGIYNRADRQFTAISVMAGSSVEGSESDAVAGVIVARVDNVLTVKGASLIRTDGSVTFRDEINVTLSEETRVTKPRRNQEELSINDLSVGQAIIVLGNINVDDEITTMDAAEGQVRMQLTFVSGFKLSQDSSLLTIDLQSLQGRSPELYDFSGTGVDASFDAEPGNYEVAIENLIVSELEISDPVRVTGFVNAFGAAPADFNALSVINYSTSRSQLLIDWPDADEVVAFSEISSESMRVNIQLVDGVNSQYKLIQGGIRTELTHLATGIQISPLSERGLYLIKVEDGVIAFSNFAEFTTALQIKLNEGASVDGLHASGGFARDTGVFSAAKLAIKLN